MRWTTSKQLVLVLGLAVGVRLVAGVYWQSRHPDHFSMGDSDGYFTLGRAIAEGRPYEYGPQQGADFPYPGLSGDFGAVFRLAGGHAVLAARLENALLGTLAVAGVWWLSRQLFGPRAALLAAALAAFYPESIAAAPWFSATRRFAR